VIVSLLGRNPIAREGLERILVEQGFEVAGIGTDAFALSGVVGPPDPDIDLVHLILVDGLVDSLGSSITHTLSNEFPTARMIILSDTFDFEVMVECFRQGAYGYIVKNICSTSLVASLNLVAMGEKVMPSNLAEVLPRHPSINTSAATSQSIETAGLSLREVQILSCLVAGHPNKVISRQLGISEATVKVHVKAILRKVGVQNRTQAAIWAVGEKLPSASTQPMWNGAGCAKPGPEHETA